MELLLGCGEKPQRQPWDLNPQFQVRSTYDWICAAKYPQENVDIPLVIYFRFVSPWLNMTLKRNKICVRLSHTFRAIFIGEHDNKPPNFVYPAARPAVKKNDSDGMKFL